MSPIEHLLDAFPKDIRFVYRHFPLTSIHDKAHISARAAEAAGRQGSFFEYHHLLYERVSEWGGLPGEDGVRQKFAEYAVELLIVRKVQQFTFHALERGQRQFVFAVEFFKHKASNAGVSSMACALPRLFEKRPGSR